MAKPIDAAQKLAAMLEVPAVRAGHTARVLREAGRDLWPALGSGARRGSVAVRHLVNLLIALYAVDATPIEAPRIVDHYRGLKADPARTPVSLGADPEDTALLAILRGAADLGAFLDGLTERLCSASAPSFLGSLVRRRATIVLEKGAHTPPRAILNLDGGAVVHFEGPQRDIIAESGLSDLGFPGPSFTPWIYDSWEFPARQTNLPCGVFLKLISILRDGQTDRDAVPLSSGKPPASSTAGHDNAGPPPEGPALSGHLRLRGADHTAAHQDGASNTSEGNARGCASASSPMLATGRLAFTPSRGTRDEHLSHRL
jgi:hypothetical protein